MVVVGNVWSVSRTAMLSDSEWALIKPLLPLSAGPLTFCYIPVDSTQRTKPNYYELPTLGWPRINNHLRGSFLGMSQARCRGEDLIRLV